MSVHGRHVNIPPGHLDPDCERCQEITIGDLDNEHLTVVCGVTRAQLQEEFGINLDGSSGPFAAFWDAIISANALRVQARYRDVRHHRERFLERRA